MTRTNRNIGEPPNLDPLAETESAACHRAGRGPTAEWCDGRPEPHAPGSTDTGVAWGVALGGVFFAIAICAGLWTSGAIDGARRALARTAAPPIAAPAALTTGCLAPAQGDTVVINVRNSGERLSITCTTLTDWRSPERSPK